MNNQRWYEFAVDITLKINEGSFGIKYDHQGEFRFCAQSRHDAIAIAGHYVKDSVSTIATTKLVEIVGSVSVSREVFPLATENSVHCAGALIFNEKRDAPHQMMRICERLGMYDARRLDMDAPVR